MRRFILPLFLGIFFLTLQTTLLMTLPIQRIRPDIVLILILYLSLSYPLISGGILTVFFGYLMDLFSGNSFGLYTFSRPLIFFMAQFFMNRFYLKGFSSQFIFVFIFALLEGLLILILLSVLNLPFLHNLYHSFFTFFIPQSFFTGLIAPLLFSLFDKGLVFLNQREVHLVKKG